MSLQVWLPLNGDLKNYGLCNLEYTINTNPTFVANGKIGQAMSMGQITMSANNMKSIFSKNTFSICFWIYINADTGDTAKRAMLFGNNSPRRYSLFQYSTCNDLHWSWANDTTNNVSGVYSGAFPSYKWTHCAVTYDSTQLKIYLNGSLAHTVNVTYAPVSLDYSTVLFSNCANSARYLNDYRIYDHALSAKEIKEIAKGLMLHYKLNDKYAEPTQNLITTADCLSSTCYNGATSKYSYGTTTNMYKEVTTFDGHHGTKVYMGTNGDPAFPYVYVNGMFTSDGTNQPAYKTLSFDYYSNISTSIRAYKLGSGNGTATYRLTNSNGISTGTGNDAVSIPIIPNEWNHVEITFHGTTVANSEWGYIQNYPSHTSNTNNFWFFSNMQLETKDHATGYAGVGGIRSNGVVYDSSGYQYDAVLIGETTIRAGDSARYDAYAYFNGSSGSTIKCNTNKWMIQGTEQLTINFWAKAITWPTNGGRIISCTESGGWNLEGGNSGYWRFPVHVYTDAAKSALAYKYDSKEIKISDLIANEWNMITLVYDAAQGTKTYINGELHHTYNNVSYGIHYNTNVRLHLGCEAAGSPTTPYFVGQESDFRIYATVLSAEDIKELYNTSASIDNKGNIYAREVIEI